MKNNTVSLDTNMGRALSVAAQACEDRDFFLGNTILKGLHGVGGFIAYRGTPKYLVSDWGWFKTNKNSGTITFYPKK